MPIPDGSYQPGEDLQSLIREVNVPLVAATPVGELSASQAFRLDFADGRTLKGRQLATAREAARTEYVLRCVHHPAFPSVLARHDRAILTDWVDGTQLNQVDLTPALARRCGALQGLLHRTPLPPATPYQPRIELRSEARLRKDLGALAQAGLIDANEVQALCALALRHAPSSCAVGFVHTDFCGENIIVRQSGDLCVVDNDALTVDELDFDLGRTWYRWPMPVPQRAAYLAGYDALRSSRDFATHFPFWAVAATVASAVFRLRHMPQAADLPTKRLRHLLERCADDSSAEELLQRCDAA